MFLEQSLHLPKKPVILTMNGASLDTHRVAFPVLQETGFKAVIFSLAAPPGVSWGGVADHPLSSQMPIDQLREMSFEGMEIGSLSMTYPNLSSVRPDIAREEIVRSKDVLEHLLETTVLTFAYPYGAVTQQTKTLVAEAKYAFACGWSTGPLRFDADPFEIRRVTVRSGMGAFELGMNLRVPQFARAIWRAGS